MQSEIMTKHQAAVVAAYVRASGGLIDEILARLWDEIVLHIERDFLVALYDPPAKSAMKLDDMAEDELDGLRGAALASILVTLAMDILSRCEAQGVDVENMRAVQGGGDE